MEFKIKKTKKFDTWLKQLRDRKAVLNILQRIDRASLGNFGDHEPVGSGVYEMRLHTSPGYRVYYTIRDNKIIFLLQGGNKSTQKKDINKAKTLAKNI
jgi:putative addiction module killer protein